MNILIPHRWLLEYLDTKAQPEEIARVLSLAGPSVERVEEVEGDWVYDIEVTTNRIDSYSVMGIAREAAIILAQAGIPAQFKPAQPPDGRTQALASDLPLPTIENDPQLCKRITCVILNEIERAPTPDWMATRLRQAGFLVHEAAIDITNYVTHDIGHPCHAFDYHKVMDVGGLLKVTQAKPGETFITLDGETYTTVGGEVVFKNQANEIIDLPSIKGTANTSVDKNTKAILLLLESIEPDKVRFASMTHAIRTTAAQLLEKNVDPHLASLALNRGVELYTDLCSATVASPVFDEFSRPVELIKVKLPLSAVTAQLEVDLSANQVSDILTGLGCHVEQLDEHLLQVTPPTFRSDIAQVADLIEEVARIYGYHNLPSYLMPTALPLNPPTDEYFDTEAKIRSVLSVLGWQELYTYSMVSSELAEQSGLLLSEHLRIKNPLTSDREVLRRSLVPSLVEGLQANPIHAELSVFEIAKVYHPQPNSLPNEELHLTLVSRRPYRAVRGDFEALLDKLFVTDVRIEPKQNNQAKILVGATEVGTVSVLNNQVICIDCLFKPLARAVHSHPTYVPLAKTAQLHEKLTFTLPVDQAVGPVMGAIQTVSPVITALDLTEVYQQNFTFSLTFYDPDRNLTAADVEPIRSAIVRTVESQFAAKLVGHLDVHHA